MFFFVTEMSGENGMNIEVIETIGIENTFLH